ncbi:putative GGDEF domain containting protein [gamma proteobacterium IMCC1989]|nr:putative GGDEF domain containting protein [gamma proteobacterium IMCC1989]
MLNSILNSLDTHIAVINREGFICYVNDAWQRFAADNGMAQEGVNWQQYNYLAVCQQAAASNDHDALSVLGGLQNVMNNKQVLFEHEYPCHTPSEQRWYIFKAVPLIQQSGHFLISHQTTTKAKLSILQAEQLSIEDHLTTLYNRRGLEILAEKEFARAKRDDYSVGLIVFDVDHFKLFNDYFGHIAGDLCLKRIASVIKTYARRPGDIAARIGGDEFVLMLSRVAQQQASDIIESVRHKIQEMNLTIAKNEQVTISGGCAVTIPKGDKSDFQTLYYNADQALYIAKNQRSSARTA